MSLFGQARLGDRAGQRQSVDEIVASYRRRSLRRVVLIAAATRALAATVLTDIITGPADLGFWRTLHVILDPSVAAAMEIAIIWDLRLPIALLGVVVEAMLGVAGTEIQTILN